MIEATLALRTKAASTSTFMQDAYASPKYTTAIILTPHPNLFAILFAHRRDSTANSGLTTGLDAGSPTAGGGLGGYLDSLNQEVRGGARSLSEESQRGVSARSLSEHRKPDPAWYLCSRRTPSLTNTIIPRPSTQSLVATRFAHRRTSER